MATSTSRRIITSGVQKGKDEMMFIASLKDIERE